MIILEGQKDIYAPIRAVSETGGQANVYICQNQNNDRFVGLIYRDMTGIDPRVRRFLYETESPAFVKLIDHGITDFKGARCAFEIFEYMRDGNLAEQSPMDETFVMETVVSQLNEGLHAFHEAGFLHRDIKPTNLYLLSSDDGKQVKIGDFGTAVVMDRSGSFSDATLAFTPGYVPSEVLGTGVYSPASDYYSMAVTLYYLVTGKQIYEGLLPDEIMLRTRRGDLVDLGMISKRLATLLEGLMIQDARYRWGYKEVCDWCNGANVPVFRYTLEEQVLDPPYRLTANISCASLKELAEAICENPLEGEKHLYGGLVSDSIRRNYQHLAVAISDLVVKRFPYAHHAGLTAAVRTLNPSMEGIFWNDRVYRGLFELLGMVRDELAEHLISPTTEELLSSGILPWYYEGSISASDHALLKEVAKLAATDPQAAATKMIFGLLPVVSYAPDKNTLITSIKEYIQFLQMSEKNLREQILKDFNSTYFRGFLDCLGLGNAFREWLHFFYGGDLVVSDTRVVGNACQFLERVCSEEQAILRHFVLEEIYVSPEYWLKNHLGLYKMDEMMERMVTENFDSTICDERKPVSELMRTHHEMKEYMDELRRDFLNNPWLYESGTYDTTGYRITSNDLNAYFVPGADGELVPVGWLREYGALREKTLADAGLLKLREEAVVYLGNLSEHVRGFSNNEKYECDRKKKERKKPGILTGIVAILVSVLMLLCISRFSDVYVKDGSILTKVLFVLIFLCDMLLFFAGIRRVVLAIKYSGIIRSIGNLDKKAKEIEALGDEVSKSNLSFEKNLERKHRNLEMEAQAERAYGGFLLKYRKLKNGVVRYYLFLIMAVTMLTGALYLDGSIDLTKESLQKQIAIVMTKGNKKDTHKKKNDNADTVYVVSVSNARLRTGPGTSYETLNGYDNGSVVVLTGEKQSDGSHIWYKVTAEDGTVGWMRSDMIKESK